MQPRFVFAASVLFSVELANWIQIWEAPALPQFSHWLCTCSSSKYSDSFQRNFKADCYNQVEITSTNSRWTSWPKLETGGQSFLFSKYFHSSRWEYWIHETILQFRRILSLTINSINYVRYEKRVGEAELAEGRLAKAEPDPGGAFNQITNYKLQITNYKLQKQNRTQVENSPNYKLQITNHNLQIANCKSRTGPRWSISQSHHRGCGGGGHNLQSHYISS